MQVPSTKLPYLQRRAIVPVDVRPGRTPGQLPDMANVQGDIYYMFPKRWERFLCFTINNADDFRKALDEYFPRVTNSKKTMKDVQNIHDRPGGNLNITSHAIGFTRNGLNTLGIMEKLRDPHFDQGPLINEKAKLGDMAEYDEAFVSGNNHGVFIICSGSQESCLSESNAIKDIFGSSITELGNYEGRVRSGDGEFFGWRDGISQPALEGLVQARPGQRVVKPGVIIMGYPGDPVLDVPTALQRPSWTKDGAFLVFRKLEQNVLFFEDYIEKNWRSIPANERGNGVYLTDEERKTLFGARMVGRFKSGVPLALSPYKEDRQYLHPDKINNFDYSESYGRCPFSAHIRKTAPRNLGPHLTKEFMDASVIVRAGIPYGPEISIEERQEWAKMTSEEKKSAKCDRGLLFACYQSSIENGFYRQTTQFANNSFFPPIGFLPKKTGQDPILGGPKYDKTPLKTIDDEGNVIDDDNARTFYSEEFSPPEYESPNAEFDVTMKVKNKEGDRFEVAGIAKKLHPTANDYEQEFFVTSRGGDYYFMPGLSTLKS
ncbi:hypothetical protein CC1G_15505 [Coprinopsis cinerea okayama7|uniref:DyP dimeric alpha+beta barrel domain-containing protein n=1 Tax=Coprinopsis cinerea (strain Okayama-7 / 130 / ATCC MYA-4618 / FGSC 9003) TaxID=240176 RepID=D6RN49_COPC7|nr:hypothetical protein CC1G_15505 [Coprinopsis cinerea okayama7\|eukprot:XP_002910964.1 hypothetical protein CC1G_15505 [Coprinopsis cinerea okayama7\